MNIRRHVLKAIYAGLPARFDMEAEQGGVTFTGEGDGEFIPFSDLGSNKRLGYYRLSSFPDVKSECTNENPETVHLLQGANEDDVPMYVWRDGDGYLHLLGELHQVADLYNALGELLCNFRTTGDPISEFDPAWGRNYDIKAAVEEAVAYGLGEDRKRVAAAIRAAARAGRIRGASRVDGRWSIPPTTLRGWLARSQHEKRGRPRGGGDD